MTEGFVDGITDPKYLEKWEIQLTTGKQHSAKYIRFHDFASIASRWENTVVNEAGEVYYKHWLNCQQTFGAGNDNCRKIRWFASKLVSPPFLAEWDDWWKDEHYDMQIGQHWNRICHEEFEEASTMLKDLKDKREGLSVKFRELLRGKEGEDPMSKILKQISQMEEPSKTPVSDLVEAGSLSKADVESAAALKIKELKALEDDAVWKDIKGNIYGGLVGACAGLKAAAKAVEEFKASAEAQRNRADTLKFSVPHMKVDYERPGLYEYETWFGKFIPRTTQFGFEEQEE